MIRFSEYRKDYLRRSFDKKNVIESVNKHFDLLQIDLLESVNLPRNLNEGYAGEAAWILDMIAEEDREFSHATIREHVAICKQEFHRYMCESIDFDAFLTQGGPQGIEGLQETDKLLKRVRWALDGFKDHVKKMVAQIIGNRAGGTAPTASSAPASAGPSASSTQTAPSNTSGPIAAPTPPDPNNAPQVAQYGNAQSSPSGSAAPWWFRKTKSGPNWWKGSTNLAKSAVKGVWDKVKSGWRGDNLADSTRAKIVNLVENLFEQTEADLLSTIDQWTEKLYNYLKQNIDSYAKAAPAAAATAPTTTTPGIAPTPSVAAPMAPTRKPRSAPTHNLSDADFEAKIRAGEPVFSSVLANKSAGAGISLAKNLERYNAFREKYGLTKLDKLPKWETEALSKEELEGYKALSQDRMRAWAENPAGKRRLRQLATSFGLETPKSRNVEFWKDFATQVHQKLQSGEQPKVVAPEVPPQPVTPATAAVEPKMTAPTQTAPAKVDFPKEDPTAIAPRVAEPTKPVSKAHTLAQRMGYKLGDDTVKAPTEPTRTKSIFDFDDESTPSVEAPKAEEPKTAPEAAPVQPEEPTAKLDTPSAGNDDPTVRAEKLKSNFMHDITAFKNGVDRDGNNIALPDADKYALGDEELSGIVDQLATQKGGLANVSDDDLLYAANDRFVNNYINGTGESPDVVRNKVAAIIDGTPGPNDTTPSAAGDDIDAMLGQFDDEHDASEKQKASLIDDAMSKIPNEVLGHIDDEAVSKMRQHVSRLIDQHPESGPDELAKKVMGLAAQMSKAYEIYNTLPPNIQSELNPSEMKSMIFEMLNNKTLQNVTCPNCDGQPGRTESCPRCRGKGQIKKLTSVSEDKVQSKLVEAIQKKKMESTVDPMTKEPEYQEFRNLWPTDQAARSDLFRQVQIEQAKGGSLEDIHNRLKNHMAKAIAQDKKKQQTDSTDDDADYWGDEEREQNGPLIQAREILSNERMPGSTDTYFNFLNSKLGDAERVDQEIRTALKATGNDLPRTIDFLKNKFGDMSKVA